MTNLEYFKKKITADNLCDTINCSACPMFNSVYTGDKPCHVKLKEWAKKQHKGGK